MLEIILTWPNICQPFHFGQFPIVYGVIIIKLLVKYEELSTYVVFYATAWLQHWRGDRTQLRLATLELNHSGR